MGNCLRHESEMHWAGEDWDEFISDDHHHSSKTSREAKTVIVTQDYNKASDPSHEIKIRLTKKQLQELLNKVNVHDLTFYQQAFSCPSQINRGNEEANHQRLWRPVLQSIPEVN